MERALGHANEVTVSSYGGLSTHGLGAAALIIAARANGRVEDVCASACLEQVLPAFETVTLIDAPLILAHGNTRMKRDLAIAAGADMSTCPLDSLFFAEAERVLGDRLIPDNPRRQIAVLGIHDVAYEMRDGWPCPRMTWKTEVDYWAPTRDELVEWFGVNAQGDSAADRPDLIQRRVNCHFTAGARVRAAGAVIISEGHDAVAGCNAEASRTAPPAR